MSESINFYQLTLSACPLGAELSAAENHDFHYYVATLANVHSAPPCSQSLSSCLGRSPTSFDIMEIKMMNVEIISNLYAGLPRFSAQPRLQRSWSLCEQSTGLVAWMRNLPN